MSYSILCLRNLINNSYSYNLHWYLGHHVDSRNIYFESYSGEMEIRRRGVFLFKKSGNIFGEEKKHKTLQNIFISFFSIYRNFLGTHEAFTISLVINVFSDLKNCIFLLEKTVRVLRSII